MLCGLFSECALPGSCMPTKGMATRQRRWIWTTSTQWRMIPQPKLHRLQRAVERRPFARPYRHKNDKNITSTAQFSLRMCGILFRDLWFHRMEILQFLPVLAGNPTIGHQVSLSNKIDDCWRMTDDCTPDSTTIALCLS